MQKETVWLQVASCKLQASERSKPPDYLACTRESFKLSLACESESGKIECESESMIDAQIRLIRFSSNF